jgi:hypothetical protein
VVTANGEIIGVEPGAVIIGLSTASIVASGESVAIAPGPITVALSTAQLAASGESISVLSDMQVNLDTAVINAVGFIIAVGGTTEDGTPIVIFTPPWLM